jgi:PIN domain nuclease of toxin-antitoxin system
MPTICDTHILLFWADAPQRLSTAARDALDQGMAAGQLACCDISLWEIAMLQARGRIHRPPDLSIAAYLDDIVLAMGLTVLPITPAIAEQAQHPDFLHGDPADRLIAATALVHKAPIITADGKLRQVPGLRCVW